MERHLKCDEGTPDCQNCRKSSRICKRGIRLNFHDLTVKQPPVVLKSQDWNVLFQDESRAVASEYVDGRKRYAPWDVPVSRTAARTPPFYGGMSTDNRLDEYARRPGPMLPSVPDGFPTTVSEERRQTMASAGPVPGPTSATVSKNIPSQAIPEIQPRENSPAHSFGRDTASPLSTSATMRDHAVSPAASLHQTRKCIEDSEGALFMQAFVEEVAIWMDSLDPMKHFSRILPFVALNEPMLLNAILACGARHMVLVNSAFHESRALHYYDTATSHLLAELAGDANRATRNIEMCATAAIILNVYEVMSERPAIRLNHIAGARTLLRECGWSARTPGIGGACFWLNVSMEVLTCARYTNMKPSWNPDEWGVDMDFNRPTDPRNDEIWAHRAIYLLGRIVTFRSLHMGNTTGARDRQYAEEWTRLREQCRLWNQRLPRNMQPLSYLHPYQTHSKSPFPEVWIIKRCAIVSKLFYHTSMILLAQTSPNPPDNPNDMAITHAHQICGITATVKDRGVASVSLRSLHTAAECLIERREQEAVLEIFTEISTATGWRIDWIHKALKVKWGWEPPPPAQHPAIMPVLQSNNVGQDDAPQLSSINQPHSGPQPHLQLPQNHSQPLHSQKDFPERTQLTLSPSTGPSAQSSTSSSHPHSLMEVHATLSGPRPERPRYGP